MKFEIYLVIVSWLLIISFLVVLENMERQLTIIEHLDELRKRIIICLIFLGIGSVFSLPFASWILKFLKLPAEGLIDKLYFFNPQEAFLIYMRIAFFGGLIVSMPVILYQIWIFILPAIEEKLKSRLNSFISFSFASFVSGCLFAYFFLLSPALKFLLSFASDDLMPIISAGKYISFVLTIILGCGFVFQMPVLSLILTKIGIINYKFLRKKYKYAIVVILVVAAIITPTPDAFNMFILALPMLMLYEISIWLSWLSEAKTYGAKHPPSSAAGGLRRGLDETQRARSET